jgi:hypothetical protein
MIMAAEQKVMKKPAIVDGLDHGFLPCMKISLGARVVFLNDPDQVRARCVFLHFWLVHYGLVIEPGRGLLKMREQTPAC